MKELQAETAEALLKAIKRAAENDRLSWSGLNEIAQAYDLVMQHTTEAARSAYEDSELVVFTE